MELRGEDLLLRPLEAGDADAFVDACNDPEIVRFIPMIPVPYMHADFQAWIERCGRVEASEESHPFVIVDARSGEMLGSIELHRAAGSVGYWIAPGARNRGIATAALRLICDWWRERPLRLTTHVDNTASQRVAQKAGFVRTGTEQHDPKFADGSAEVAVFRLD